MISQLQRKEVSPRKLVLRGANGAVAAATRTDVTFRFISPSEAHELWPTIKPLLQRTWHKHTYRTAISHYWRPEDAYAMVTGGRVSLVKVGEYGWFLLDRQQIPFSNRFMLYVWLGVGLHWVPKWARRVISNWLDVFRLKAKCTRIAFLSNRPGMERFVAPYGYVRGSTWFIKDFK